MQQSVRLSDFWNTTLEQYMAVLGTNYKEFMHTWRDLSDKQIEEHVTNIKSEKSNFLRYEYRRGLAKAYSSKGMLEPFDNLFVISNQFIHFYENDDLNYIISQLKIERKY